MRPMVDINASKFKHPLTSSMNFKKETKKKEKRNRK